MSSSTPVNPSEATRRENGDDYDDDDQLLRRAVQDRDHAALAELLVAAHDRLLVYIRRRLPLDLERHIDAEDILHDTFAAAFQEISTLRSTSRAAFHSWLTTVARNRLRNVAKAQRALKRGSRGARDALSARPGDPRTDDDAMADDLLEMLARTSRSPRSVAGNQEYIAMMRRAIEELEPEHRVVLRLRFIEDLPHAQIAEQTGRSEAAVRQLCLRALRRLRGLLPAISAQD